MPERLKEYHNVFSNNLIAKNRLKKVGYLSKEDAISYAITNYPADVAPTGAVIAARSILIPYILNLSLMKFCSTDAIPIQDIWSG